MARCEANNLHFMLFDHIHEPWMRPFFPIYQAWDKWSELIHPQLCIGTPATRPFLPISFPYTSLCEIFRSPKSLRNVRLLLRSLRTRNFLPFVSEENLAKSQAHGELMKHCVRWAHPYQISQKPAISIWDSYKSIFHQTQDDPRRNAIAYWVLLCTSMNRWEKIQLFETQLPDDTAVNDHPAELVPREKRTVMFSVSVRLQMQAVNDSIMAHFHHRLSG